MKLDTTVKLSDVIKVITAIVVVTAFVITDRMDVASLRKDRDADHAILADLSRGFAELSKWQSATDVRINDQQRIVDSQTWHRDNRAMSPKEKEAGQ